MVLKTEPRSDGLTLLKILISYDGGKFLQGLIKAGMSQKGIVRTLFEPHIRMRTPYKAGDFPAYN